MKKLKILLGNNTLSFLGGSETWTMTLALQLKEMGHEVVCYSPSLGVISDKLIKEGIKCYSEIKDNLTVNSFSIVLEEKVEHNYDVIIANHNHIVAYLRNQFPKTPIISTIHGIIHESEGKIAPEHPALDSGVNQFVAVSEEIQAILKEKYNIEAPVIRNFFDLKKFDFKPANEKPKQFLINTNYADANSPEILTIKEVAKHFDAKVTAIGMNFSQTLDTRKALEDADVVFGMGRSVLEGVAGGRLGIIHGRWGTGGAIKIGNVDFADIRYFNFSGRNSEGKFATKEELIQVIENNYGDFDEMKNYMAREHNVIVAAEEYVRLARELTGELILKPEEVVDTRRPYKRAND